MALETAWEAMSNSKSALYRLAYLLAIDDGGTICGPSKV